MNVIATALRRLRRTEKKTERLIIEISRKDFTPTFDYDPDEYLRLRNRLNKIERGK